MDFLLIVLLGEKYVFIEAPRVYPTAYKYGNRFKSCLGIREIYVAHVSYY